ncbi:MAG TPA: DUF3152 domain-containing protein [Micromonosporaceae bacterium]
MPTAESDPPAPPPDGAGADSTPQRNRLLALASLVLACGTAALLVAIPFPSDGDRVEAALFRAPAPMESEPPSTGEPAVPDVAASPLPGSALGPPAERSAPDADTRVLRMPGPVPPTGPGTFTYASDWGAVLGRSGTVRRYRVAVENGANETVQNLAVAVDAALGDVRSWTAGGRLRLQRVPGGAPHDFTVYLATAQTAGRMCAAGGVDIRVGGRPYTSCRATGKVVLNLDRWHLSVDHFVAAGVPLAVYRTYVINHEVGHELGRRHENCPRPGLPAPVMMQQSLFLNGCLANPWPFPGSVPDVENRPY